ncbi:TOBE domain protein [Tolumonas auensis DSM 9187]|uniref:TOBE domain protein n=1 Tax=Tolumonas auensis (strain DSM 9187 / NBRC 110442 / TA 4) TaxID=595494 RepID=C4LDZ8_TOLAT|nr:TOBE domain-containing protein [Tolumonas auensis]ACQ92819.1 TOBE domain protein [Tolumonas auensis DSM 9187]
MAISARNVFAGTVSEIREGAVNAEVSLAVTGGDVIVATVTLDSLKALGLAVGTAATAFVKAPSIMLVTGNDSVRFSARNHLKGSVTEVKTGAVNSEVVVKLAGGSEVKAIVTNDAVTDLALSVGSAAGVLFKAGSVILGVSA